ncbi:hypothetical protein IWQ61_010638, partial [Dispira simplex]
MRLLVFCLLLLLFGGVSSAPPNWNNGDSLELPPIRTVLPEFFEEWHPGNSLSAGNLGKTSLPDGITITGVSSFKKYTFPSNQPYPFLEFTTNEAKVFGKTVVNELLFNVVLAKWHIVHPGIQEGMNQARQVYPQYPNQATNTVIVKIIYTTIIAGLVKEQEGGPFNMHALGSYYRDVKFEIDYNVLTEDQHKIIKWLVDAEIIWFADARERELKR